MTCVSRAEWAYTHRCNLAAGEPCSSDCLGDAGSCKNKAMTDRVCEGRAPWLPVPGRGTRSRHARGLFAMAPLSEGMFVASFGPLLEASSPAAQRAAKYTLLVRTGNLSDAGGAWSRTPKHMLPPKTWRHQGYLGPLVNHSCCTRHVNCEFVPTETTDGDITVWVKMLVDVDATASEPVELLAHYGEYCGGLVGDCQCCQCVGTCPM